MCMLMYIIHCVNLPLSVASLIFFLLFYCSHSPLIWFAISFHFILEVQVYRIRCIFPNLSFIHVWLPSCSHLHYIGYAFVVFISSFMFFFFFCYSSPILFCWSIVLRVGTYHLQLMHTICLLKWTQWFSNATNKDNNKCLLINTFSSTFQCFRSKLDSFQQLRFLHTHKNLFHFWPFSLWFYWTTVLYVYIFCSVLHCNAFIIYKHHKIKNKRFQFQFKSKQLSTYANQMEKLC